MTETTILDDRAVSEIEARANAATEGPWEPRDVSPFGDEILIDTVQDGLRGAIATVINPARFMSSVRQQEEKDTQTRADALFIQHAREDIPALCATVRHLRERLDHLESKPHFLVCGARIDALQSQLEQLRAENERLRRTIEAPSHSDSMKIGIPQSPLCGDVNCPLHGDYPNTCVTQPVCSRGYVPPVNNTIVI